MEKTLGESFYNSALYYFTCYSINPAAEETTQREKKISLLILFRARMFRHSVFRLDDYTATRLVLTYNNNYANIKSIVS